MTDTSSQPDSPKPTRGKLPLFAGAMAALLAAGGGYYAVASGLLFAPAGTGDAEHHEAGDTAHAPSEVAFVPLDPVMVNLGGGVPRHLRFEGYLEVAPGRESSVAALMPRIMDVLNGYLRAVETSDITDPAALIRLRAQMLRRLQVVTGEGNVRDLLITSFLVS